MSVVHKGNNLLTHRYRFDLSLKTDTHLFSQLLMSSNRRGKEMLISLNSILTYLGLGEVVLGGSVRIR